MTFAPDFYEVGREGCIQSAARIVPLVVALTDPARVIDVGCGEGWFARAFAHEGCTVLALDGSVEGSRSEPHITFVHADLEGELDPTFSMEQPDLAVCLEVLEHLTPGAGDRIVAWLCQVAPLVLWSAAVPGQGGHQHINEQWPQYWADRFLEHGYHTHDEIRWALWDDDTIEPWYRQNLMLSANPLTMARLGLRFTDRPLPVLHPAIFGGRRA